MERKTVEKINETNSLSFERVKKTDKLLAGPTEKEKR